MKFGGSKGVCIWLPFNPRDGVCKICGKSVHNEEIKFTNIHHTKYAYRPSTVKKAVDNGNYSLALENTVECCYAHHNMMDAIRTLLTVTDLNIIMKGLSFLPEEHKKRLYEVSKLFIAQYEKMNEEPE